MVRPFFFPEFSGKPSFLATEYVLVDAVKTSMYFKGLF